MHVITERTQGAVFVTDEGRCCYPDAPEGQQYFIFHQATPPVYEMSIISDPNDFGAIDNTKYSDRLIINPSMGDK